MRSPLCLSSRFRRNQDSLSIALALVLLAGCAGGDGIILPDEGEPAAIAVVKGDNQRGLVGVPLANPLVVEVTDSRGRTVAGATVAFEFSAAGAGAAVVPEEKITDADGRAETTLVLGTTIGRQTGQARVVQAGAAAIQVPFSAMALPENANTMAAVAGQDQTGHVGQPLDDRLVVEVTDNFGNPVAGVPINWAAAGGGSVSAAVVETDEDGRSRVERILGPAVGQQSAVASADGLAGSPVTFTHTALAGDASRLTIISGNDQTAEAGTALPAELVVQLIDADGNGVPQTAVSWVVATGGGSATPEISTTDGEGRTSAQWTLGAALGQQRLDAVVSGVGVATFHATAASSAPPSLFIRTQPSASARNGIPLGRQPVLQLRDSQGNDVSQAGVQVTAVIGSGGGELGGERQMSTDASGRATFTNLSISGDPGPRVLIFTAPGYAQVTSSEIALEAIGTSTTITGDSPDPSGVGAPFTVSFQVSSQGPVPTGSVTVSDGAESCSGPLVNGAGSCQLSLTNVGQRTLTATYAGEPGLAGSSDTESHIVAAAPPPPPATTTTTITSDDPDPSVSGSSFPVTFQVTSAGGTPTGTVTVRANNGPTCTGTLSGGSGSCELTLNNPGDRILTATYGGGPGFSPSAGSAPHTVGRAPVADFNWHCEDLTCFFEDRSRDDDGSITARHWNWGDGTSTESELNPSHTYALAGEYRVILTATDNSGLTDDAEDTVDPNAPPPPNQAPTPEFTSQCNELDCQFTDASNDNDGRIESRAWEFGDGETSNNRNPDHEYAAGGTYTVRLTVTDDDGASAFVEHAVTVAGPPPPPANTTTTVSTNPDPSEPGASITVNFSVTSLAPGTLTGDVQVTDPNGAAICQRSAPSGSCDYTPDWVGDSRTITATYGGNSSFSGSSDTYEHTVNPPPPQNQPPTASFTLVSCVELTCSFDANGSADPDGNIADYNWSFGDGQSANGTAATTSHPYAVAGSYDVTLTVTDDDGLSATTGPQQVNPTAPPTPEPPPAGE